MEITTINVLKFNEIDEDGNIFLPSSISSESLVKLKMSGKILDYEINDDRIIIKKIELDSASI